MSAQLNRSNESLAPKTPFSSLVSKGRHALAIVGLSAMTMMGCGAPPEKPTENTKVEDVRKEVSDVVDGGGKNCVPTFTTNSNCNNSEPGAEPTPDGGPKTDSDEVDENKEVDHKSSMGKPTLDCSKTGGYCRDGGIYSGSFNIENIDFESLNIFSRAVFGKSATIKIFDISISEDGKTITYECKIKGNPGSEFKIVSEARGLNGKRMLVESDVLTIY